MIWSIGSADRRRRSVAIISPQAGSPGRSMFVRLTDNTKGPAGKWTDAATGEHGDLLDVIRESRSLFDFTEVVAEAEAFLRLPRSWQVAEAPVFRTNSLSRDSVTSARRLFAAA